MIGSSLQSSVEIAFRYDKARSRTVLAKRQAGGLCHLSKPYWTGEVLGLQLVNLRHMCRVGNMQSRILILQVINKTC